MRSGDVLSDAGLFELLTAVGFDASHIDPCRHAAARIAELEDAVAALSDDVEVAESESEGLRIELGRREAEVDALKRAIKEAADAAAP